MAGMTLKLLLTNIQINMLTMFSSATRLSLLVMVLVLCGVNVFALIMYPDTTFNTTFKLFSDILIAVTSFFFGKSTGGEQVTTKPDIVDITSK